MELEMDCLKLRRLLQKVCICECQFCTEHFPVFSAGLSSSYDGWAKCKEKVLDMSDPNQNVETRSHSTLQSLQNSRIYLSKGCRKTSQR